MSRENDHVWTLYASDRLRVAFGTDLALASAHTDLKRISSSRRKYILTLEVIEQQYAATTGYVPNANMHAAQTGISEVVPRAKELRRTIENAMKEEDLCNIHLMIAVVPYQKKSDEEFTPGVEIVDVRNQKRLWVCPLPDQMTANPAEWVPRFQ